MMFKDIIWFRWNIYINEEKGVSDLSRSDLGGHISGTKYMMETSKISGLEITKENSFRRKIARI